MSRQQVGRIAFNTARPRDPWEALDALRVVLEPRPPNSFTVVEYCERYGIKRQTATSQLERLVLQKALRKQKALVNSKHTNVYWILEASRTGTSGSKPARKDKKIPNGNVEVQSCPSSKPSTTSRRGKTTSQTGGSATLCMARPKGKRQR